MARSLLTLQAMGFSTSMRAAAIALSGLTAWGTSLARADEAPLVEPLSKPAPDTPPAQPSMIVSTPAPAEQPLKPAVKLPTPVQPATSRRSFAPAPPNGEASPEGGLAVGQVALGSLATLAAGYLFFLVANSGNGASNLSYAVPIGIATPAVGALVVCGLGKTSDRYEGDCGSSILGGYLGALAFAIPLGLVGSVVLVQPAQDGDGPSGAIGAVLGAALGVIVGTAVGATMAWHRSKHRREQPDALAFGPPAPPPAALASWSDLRARPTAARATAPLGVQLLSLRF
jgi:hypothetical protein